MTRSTTQGSVCGSWAFKLLGVSEMAYTLVFKTMKTISNFPTEDVFLVLFNQGFAFRNSEEELTFPFGTAAVKHRTPKCHPQGGLPSATCPCATRVQWKDIEQKVATEHKSKRASNLVIMKHLLSPQSTHRSHASTKRIVTQAGVSDGSVSPELMQGGLIMAAARGEGHKSSLTTPRVAYTSQKPAETGF